MGRVIKIESAGKDRTQLVKGIVIAMRELATQTEPDAQTRDLLAFITLSLQAIAETIDPSVEAWEKRGYWIKADRFRMDWQWTQMSAVALREALHGEDMGEVANRIADIARRLAHVKAPVRSLKGKPWSGAWARLIRG